MSGPALEALLHLQQLDTAIDQHRHRRTTLPERAELAALAASAANAERARLEVSARRDEIAGRQSAAERELAASEQRMGAVQRRMSSGEASSARDVEALSSGIEHLRERVSHLEDDILTAMEERAPLDEQVALADREAADLAARRGTVQDRLVEAEAAIDGEIVSLEAERDAARADISSELLAVYDRLRARSAGVAVARLVGTRCDGCHLTLPATELDQLRRAPADALIYCDQCGRILVRTS